MKIILILFIFLLPLFSNAQSFLIKNQKALTFSGTGDGLRTVWFSKDNNTLFGDFQHIFSWNIESGKLEINNKIEGKPLYPSDVNSNQTLWAQGGSGFINPEKPNPDDMYASISIGNPNTSDIYTYRTEKFSVSHLEFVAESNKIVVIINKNKTNINAAVIYDLDKRKIEKTFVNGGSKGDVMSSISISKDSKCLAVGYSGENQRFEVFDFEKGKIIKSFDTNYDVVGLEIENGILAAGGGNTVSVVNLESMNIESSIKTTASVFHLALSPSGQSIAVGSFSSGADIIDIETQEVNHFSDGLTNCLAFSPDGNMLAIGKFIISNIPEAVSVEIWKNENASSE